ncbi:MAG: ABC transporter ATP-binding protein [Armatimonadota bacterium]|nr:ABC transporter ATP-binding protein [Armatimonadota bacterium]MDR7426772.1 ABC transporter ATP-binding protein [Armatimonadota bacterium]MDR7464996.1 ABC transporter ATP-binding protein [Armatimonadota bacterium]MDR7469862.1 ABC transporter ATP-binding protein [Armatimonadota bacterium]MDR7474322.1 ABC transporter ATP-binding protein [Armatimonadota bacterium]
MPELLRVQRVAKAFDGFPAVDGADLGVDAGAIVAVIGPNGAGKTTLFNLITGVLRPDRGQIIFDGTEITGLPAHEICRRGIGRTFQIVNIFPRLTVFRNVQVAVLSRHRASLNLFAAADGLAVVQTERILADTGLLSKADHLAGTLSHGDQRILEIAIALGSQPRLLVLDEPTAGMSPEETAATLVLIRRLAREHGLTILFCEHDMDVVFAAAESIMVMHGGRTIMQGPPEAVRRNPAVQEAYLGAGDA